MKIIAPMLLFTMLLFPILFSPQRGFAQQSNAAQTTTREQKVERHLLGKCSLTDFKAEPFSEWFASEYNSYTPNPHILSELRRSNLKNLHFTVFLGTWCGDSKREFPRFIKLLHELSISETAVEIIAVSSADSAYKQSPNREERGHDIFRVPTVLVMEHKGNKAAGKQAMSDMQEKARIVESPVETFERDILSIVRSGEPHQALYQANYPSYPTVRMWLQNGTLADTNVNVYGLANRVRHLVSGEGELNACGYVLLSRGQVQEALTIYRVNAVLFPQSSRSFERVARGYEQLGKIPQAIRALERALEVDAKNTSALNHLIKLKAQFML